MQGILKQSSWLFIAQALGKVVGFFYTIFLAKNLGVEDFGLYSVALAYFSLVSSFADFGFNRFLIREVAKDHKKIAELLCSVGILRLTFTSFIFGTFALILYFFDPDKLRVGLILVGVLTVLPQSLSLTFDAIFVALQKLQYSSLGLVFLNISTAALGVYFINSGLGVSGGVTALLLGQLFYLIILGFILKLKKINILSEVSGAILKKILVGSLPYGLLGILGLAYFRIDTIILTYLKGNFDAGIYGAAYKFLEAIVFIPSALATALFPLLARLHDSDSDKIKRLYFSSIKMMVGLGVIIALGYFIILPKIIGLYLPNFLPAIEVIKILSLTIPFMFIHVPGAQILLSTDKYLKAVLGLSIVTLSFNIILNLIFIPQFGFLAAAWVTVLSEVLSFLVFFNLLRMRVFK